MAVYIRPDGITQANGRSLKTKPTYIEMIAQINEGEQLIGIYTRWFGWHEAVLYDEREYDEFANHLGNADLMGYYALPTEFVPKDTL